MEASDTDRTDTALVTPSTTDNRVVFVTGGAGSICSVQTKALVYLGANACIIGRNVEKTERVAKEIASVRKGAKVLGIGAVDVRNVSSLNPMDLPDSEQH